jgi:predicted extracellular nuclease
MKKSILVTMALLAVCLWAMPAMADNYVQKLVNGGFENWADHGVLGPPNNWADSNTHMTTTADSTLKRTGNYSLNFTVDTLSARRFASDQITVVAGRVYTCSLWVYDNTAGGRIRPWFWFSPSGSGGPSTYSADSAGWKLYTYAMAAPAGATALQLQLRCYLVSPATSATVNVDDVTLTETVPSANQPPQIGPLFRVPSLVPDMATVTVHATITDDTLVVKDSLYYRQFPGAFAPVSRDSLVLTTYWYHIPGHPVGDSIEYFVAAQDGSAARTVSSTQGYTVADTVMPVTPIAAIEYNTTNPGGTPPDTCYPSPLSGQTVKLRGIVTGVYQRSGYRSRFFMQDADSAWSGILVFNATGPDSVLAGDSVTIVGTVTAGPREYYGMTEIATPITTTKHASGRPLPAPLQVTSAQLGGVACAAQYEKYEGCYVELHNFTITSTTGSAGYVYWWGNDGSGDSCAIWNGLFYTGFDIPTITVGQTYPSIKGCIDYTFGKHCVSPRFSSDVTATATPPAIDNIAIYPSPMRPNQQVTAKATITSTGTIALDSLYYKLNAGTFAAVTHDSIAAGHNYWYKMASSYAISDSITYYFVAITNSAQRTQTDNAFFKIPDTSFCGVDSIYNIEFSFNQGADSSCFISPKNNQIVNICGVVTAVQQGIYKSFYVQDDRTPSAGGAFWTGLTVFDYIAGTSDTVNAAVGDRIEVNGRVNEFWGWTEIDSLISYTIHSHNNIVPAPTHIHVVDLIGGCNVGSEAYENVLVRMDSVTILSGDAPTGKYWIKDNSSSDSIPIDNDLWVGGIDQPNPVPSTGARYLSIIGVVRWEGRAGFANEYMLMPRKGSDFVPMNVVPANITAAWPVDPTHVTVLFDRAMQQASAETPSHYSTVKGLTISAATIDITRRRVTLTTSGQTNGLADTMMVVGVVDSLGTTMMNPDSVRFWQGFTPIHMAQYPKSPTNDTTAMANELITIKGVIVADSSAFFPNNFYINDNSDSVYNGIQLYLPAGQAWLNGYWPVVGDTVVATGAPTEYFNDTELNYVITYQNLYLVNHGPSPVPYHKGTNAAEYKYNMSVNEGERLEGVLCKLCDSLVVVAWGIPDTFVQLLVSLTTGDTIGIEGQSIHMNYAHPAAGAHVVGLTGVHRYRRGYWKLVPRSEADFNTGMDCGGAPPACQYLLGDVNSDDHVMGGDVTYAVRYFKGIGAVPPDSCFNAGVPTSTHWLYVSGDVNGDCKFMGSDVTRLVSYFKGISALVNCPLFPHPLIRRQVSESKANSQD